MPSCLSEGCMRQRTRTMLFDLLTLPLLIIGKAIAWTYTILFGWSDVRLSKRHDEELAQDIREKLPFLFTDFHATVNPDESLKYPRPLDYAAVVVEFEGLRLRVIRGRGDLAAKITNSDSPNSWEELIHVLELVGQKRERRYFMNLEELARSLEENLPKIRELFSPQRATETASALKERRDYDRAVTKEFEYELNRRLHERN